MAETIEEAAEEIKACSAWSRGWSKGTVPKYLAQAIQRDNFDPACAPVEKLEKIVEEGMLSKEDLRDDLSEEKMEAIFGEDSSSDDETTEQTSL